MLMKEYRICMPLTVEEYRIGQLYMISKHSHEQSERGEGVEVVQNEPYEDPEHGSGQFTEKRIYLNNKLPSWARAVVPKIFYVTEKAWNYYPYTITEYTCSFLPKFSIHIESKYEDNKGNNDNIFGSEPREEETEVCFVDIAYDEIPERHYKESEFALGLDLGGRCHTVCVNFSIPSDMTMEEVREYERATQEATNLKIGTFPPAISISETPLASSARSGPNSAPSTPLSTEAPDFLSVPKERPRKKSAPETLTLPDPGRRDSLFKLPSFFSWNSSPQPE
ncbi:cytoplasmic phosphatidylinositol transfer protein 1-like [Poecilia reticulata]|uniref:cytoplasmic phosphatidylinositol transfer protein 1-like n=1 Tax=Poecilia reticulata TaxID=8081 RepID=UPI0004A46902|nr:PREDICTED: cytoplasmic phosphatidylinositol transfer protein 1-like [Poecilia reticulata]